MRQLTILYDSNCGLCQRARLWLRQEPAFVPLEFLAAQSAAAVRRFPKLDHEATLGDLTVIGDGRLVYRGARAWIMCLWALRRHRELAMRLSSKAAFPFAKKFIGHVSKYRYRISTHLWKFTEPNCR